MPIVIHQDNGLPILPSNLELQDYQKEVIANWFKNNGRGTLKMATGSGKTITALAIATELYQKIGLQVLYQSTKWLRHFVILKPLQGLGFNSQKCCHTFVNWYY